MTEEMWAYAVVNGVLFSHLFIYTRKHVTFVLYFVTGLNRIY